MGRDVSICDSFSIGRNQDSLISGDCISLIACNADECCRANAAVPGTAYVELPTITSSDFTIQSDCIRP